MSDYIDEVKLSRAFALEFDKFWRENPEAIPPELLKAYMLLKQKYQSDIEEGKV